MRNVVACVLTFFVTGVVAGILKDASYPWPQYAIGGSVAGVGVGLAVTFGRPW